MPTAYTSSIGMCEKLIFAWESEVLKTKRRITDKEREGGKYNRLSEWNERDACSKRERKKERERASEFEREENWSPKDA